jgi:hypothetical protein
VPNRRAVPQLALWTDRRPRAIHSAQEDGRYTGAAFAPVSPAVAKQFILDQSDENKALPRPPANGVAHRYWITALTTGCE